MKDAGNGMVVTIEQGGDEIDGCRWHDASIKIQGSTDEKMLKLACQ